MVGRSICAGYGAHTPWFNITGMSSGWSHELAAYLHHVYGHEVLNVARGGVKTGDNANPCGQM